MHGVLRVPCRPLMAPPPLCQCQPLCPPRRADCLRTAGAPQARPPSLPLSQLFLLHTELLVGETVLHRRSAQLPDA